MNHTFAFDPQLPALPLAFDLAAVARLFTEQWPRAGAGPIEISKCKPQDTKYQPGRRCTTTYALTVAHPGAPAESTIGVLEITPAGPAHRLYDDDPQLPWLAPAISPQVISDHFAALLETNIEDCVITPVRYRPGVRCVFRYDLATTAGRSTFFGKLIGQGAEESMATIAALHAARATFPTMPRVLPPLAYWPDLHMLMQAEVVGGAELNDLAFDPAEDATIRERWLHDAGARLAGLHGCDVAGPARTMADDMDELREYIAPMAAANPALAKRYAATVERLAASGANGEPAAVASHGAFRTDQFMIENGELVMIDLDGFCWANPARDLGNFMAYLRWKAIRKPHDAAFIERVGQLFLDGYRAAGHMIDQAWLARYTADSLLKVAGRRYRSLTAKEWHLVPQLIDAAEEIVG
jgi:hypothetical protein